MSLLWDIGVLFSQIIVGWLEAFVHLIVPPSRKDVSGRIILITGAGHGFGRQMAHRFAKLGAKLVLWDVNRSGNEQTAREAKEFGATVFAYTVDCSKREDIYEAGEKVKRDVGQVYMLINNAGVLAGRTFLELSDEQILRTMNVNVMAHFWTLRTFLPAMIDSDDGHIVSICSIAGKLGVHREVDYCAAKHATLGLHDALQQELRVVNHAHGIKITIVYPYFVNTGIIHNVMISFLADMLDSNEGHIVSICSIAGKVGGHRLIDYCASKHAALGLHDALQQELRAVHQKTGIKTTIVYPYFTNTGIIYQPGMRFGKMLDQEPVTDVIVDAILREKPDVYIPAEWRFNVMIRDMVPQRVFEAFQDFFKIEIPDQPDKDD